MDLLDFTLDILHRHGEFVLFRGRRRRGTNPRPPSILVLMPRSEHPRPETVRMLEHEYSLRTELDPAWAVTPVEITQHEGRTVLILDDPGGEPLAQLVGTPMEMGRFLRIAIGLSVAVRQLHGRGLIHKDLKPATVMLRAQHWPGLADGLWDRDSIAARAPVGGSSRIHCGNARIHGPRANWTDESFHRFPQ